MNARLFAFLFIACHFIIAIAPSQAASHSAPVRFTRGELLCITDLLIQEAAGQTDRQFCESLVDHCKHEAGADDQHPGNIATLCACLRKDTGCDYEYNPEKDTCTTAMFDMNPNKCPSMNQGPGGGGYTPSCDHIHEGSGIPQSCEVGPLP